MIGRAALLISFLAALAAPAGAQGAPPAPPPPAAGGVGETPPVTLLYQNFPNPFRSGSSARTCIWFDLANASEVRLDVLDLRGRTVRRILPAAGFFGTVPAGRYGRGITGTCDPLISWDGTDDDGRGVHSGVYLLRLSADGERITRKIILLDR